MAENSAIEWCDSTFNPWIGCTKVSLACDHCYAEALNKRTGGNNWGNVPRRRTSEHNWNEPRRWQRKAAEFRAEHGRDRRVFCASMADVFDNQIDPTWRDDLFALIRETPDLEWLLLTKRPQNIVKMVKAIGFMPSNIAFGATIEDRERALQNLPHLMVAAGLRPRYLFASCEPLLGNLGDLSPWMTGDPFPQQLDAGEIYERGFKIGADGWPKLPAVAWWIAGGEGGGKARPSHPDWFRSIRDQCDEHGRQFLFKQWGEWKEVGHDDDGPLLHEVIIGSEEADAVKAIANHPAFLSAEGCFYRHEREIPEGTAARLIDRMGKKRAGRVLDGIEHNAIPGVIHG